MIFFFKTELYDEYGFFERLTKIENDFPGANIVLHKYGVLPQVRNFLQFLCIGH